MDRRMSKRPTVPTSPSPEDPPAPHRDYLGDAIARGDVTSWPGDKLVITSGPPTEEEIEAVACRMCELRGINPHAVEYGPADVFGPHEWHLFFIRGGYRKRGERVLDKNWRRFYYQAADALIAAAWMAHG
jgi:hypothetical protein